jgi:hypothetical protein
MQRHTTHGHVSRMALILAPKAIVGLLLAGDGLVSENQRTDA